MSKWLDATKNSDPARRHPSSSPGTKRSGSPLRALPLLLLVGFALWMWQQMPEPLPDRIHRTAPEHTNATDPGAPASPELEVRPPDPGVGPDLSAGLEAASTGDPSSSEPTSGEPGADEAVEPVIPAGGESPLDWRPLSPPTVRPAELSGWYQNHDGYIRALRRRSHVDRAMILYFRTDWCPWSRRFEDEFLAQRAVANWASEQIRVVLDAEHSFEEAELAERLGVTGFPAFYVIPPQPGKPIAIRPYPEGEAIPLKAFLTQSKRAAGL